MPGRDGTGPLGEGARTGGGFGYCATEYQNNKALSQEPVAGRYLGRGCRGGGRGFRNRCFVVAPNANTRMGKVVLDKNQQFEERMKSLQADLDEMKQQVEILNKGNQS